MELIHAGGPNIVKMSSVLLHVVAEWEAASAEFWGQAGVPKDIFLASIRTTENVTHKLPLSRTAKDKGRSRTDDTLRTRFQGGTERSKNDLPCLIEIIQNLVNERLATK